jgi:hypothetical protein
MPTQPGRRGTHLDLASCSSYLGDSRVGRRRKDGERVRVHGRTICEAPWACGAGLLCRSDVAIDGREAKKTTIDRVWVGSFHDDFVA